METLMTQPALVGDHLVLRTATEEAEIDHLRQTLNEGHYLIRLARVDLDQDISPFPGARQLVRSTREWIGRKSDELKSEARYFITSLAREGRSAARLAQAIRGHGSVENRNHWKRDTSLWQEDASRPCKKASGGQVLALLRGAILRLHDAETFAGFHHHSAKPYAALRLLKTPPPQIN